METACDKRRTLCPHCNQNISYSAYFAHKARYFDSQKSKWTLQSDLDEEMQDKQSSEDSDIPMQEGPDSNIDEEVLNDSDPPESEISESNTSLSSDEQDHEMLEVCQTNESMC